MIGSAIAASALPVAAAKPSEELAVSVNPPEQAKELRDVLHWERDDDPLLDRNHGRYFLWVNDRQMVGSVAQCRHWYASLQAPYSEDFVLRGIHDCGTGTYKTRENAMRSVERAACFMFPMALIVPSSRTRLRDSDPSSAQSRAADSNPPRSQT
jgi:hypothetical protein